MSNKPLVEMHRLVKILRLYITEYKAAVENSAGIETMNIVTAKENYANRFNNCLESLDIIKEELKYIDEQIRTALFQDTSIN